MFHTLLLLIKYIFRTHWYNICLMISEQESISYYQVGGKQEELDHAVECIKKSNNKRLLGDGGRVFGIDKYTTKHTEKEGDRRAERARAEKAHAGGAHAGRAHAGRAHAGRAHAERDGWLDTPTTTTPFCVRCGKCVAR
jgi:hypothetical protein